MVWVVGEVDEDGLVGVLFGGLVPDSGEVVASGTVEVGVA